MPTEIDLGAADINEALRYAQDFVRTEHPASCSDELMLSRGVLALVARVEEFERCLAEARDELNVLGSKQAFRLRNKGGIEP